MKVAMSDVFDYTTYRIHYKGKEYPFRLVWDPDYNCEAIVSVTSLNEALFGEKGYWTDPLAEYIDNQIIYYVSEAEITVPETMLQTILTNILQ